LRIPLGFRGNSFLLFLSIGRFRTKLHGQRMGIGGNCAGGNSFCFCRIAHRVKGSRFGVTQLSERNWLAPSESSTVPGKVIWMDGGDEVVVHLDSTQVHLLDRALLVSVDMETDQTGRTPRVVALALGNAGDPAGRVATTGELPRGNGLLAAR